MCDENDQKFGGSRNVCEYRGDQRRAKSVGFIRRKLCGVQSVYNRAQSIGISHTEPENKKSSESLSENEKNEEEVHNEDVTSWCGSQEIKSVQSDNSCYHGKSDQSSEASDQRQKAQREGELQEKHESGNDTSSKNEDHPHDDENGKDATTNDSFHRQKLSDIDAQHVDEHTDQSKSNQLHKQAVRFGIEMEIDQSKCKCVQSAGAGKSGAFRVALSVCSLLIHFIVGTIGLYECPMDANIARFVLARSSLIIVDLIYLAGFAFLANPSKRLAHIPEIRHAGSFVLSIAGAICVYPYYVRVQHNDKKLRMYCSAVCYWFAFGAATADLIFFVVLNVICCCSVLTSLHISCRNDSNQPTSENV